MLTSFLISALVTVVAFHAVIAQDDAAARAESYRPCYTAIKQAPQGAYEPCKAYLDMYPSDDARRIEFVKSWIRAYEKMRPYVQFLQSLAPEDQKASWFVYEPDLHIELPQTFEKWGQYQVEISRSFRDSYEEFMLAKAEAVYSSPSKMVEEVYRYLVFLGQDPPKEMAPLWGLRGNDNIQVPSVLTARAVRYYYDLAMLARVNPQLPTGFAAEHIGLKYDAVIKHFDQYSHNRDEFTNVYVADLTLQWSFGCGMLCGMGFTRNKLVVLDNKGNVIGMYLDSPVNSGYWVS